MKRLVISFVVLLFAIYSANCQGFWTQKSDIVPSTPGYASSACFSVANKGYLCCGITTTEVNVLWEFDPNTNIWTQKSNFPGLARRDAHAFSIGNNGYVGIGHIYNGSYNYLTDFYEYNPATNSWTQKAPFPGTGRVAAFAFSVDGKGYFGGGANGSSFLTDMWQYNPLTNAWTQMSNLPFSLASSASFTIGDFAYVGTGSKPGTSYSQDFWQYDPKTDSWAQKTNFGGIARFETTGFSMNNLGYIGTGNNASTFCNDFWQYDPLTDAWTQIASLPASVRREAISFAINNKGYVGTGYNGTSYVYLKDFWEYTPSWYGINSNTDVSHLLCVYPNPATTTLNVVGSSNLTSIEVFSIDGKLLLTKQLKNQQLDVSTLPNGVYFVKFSGSDSNQVLKFIKE